MKKVVILLAVLFTLVMGAGVLMNRANKLKDTFKDKIHTQFALADKNQIHQINIRDWTGNHAQVEKTKDGWSYTNKVSGATYRARPSSVNTLLETMVKIRTRQAVNKKAIPNVLKSMWTKSKEVSIRDKDGNLLRQYFVGMGSPEAQGTYMLMQGSEKPYIVYFPSWTGTLDTRYISKEEIWRDKAVMRFNPKEIASFKVSYLSAEDKVHSFHIKQRGTDWTILDYREQNSIQLPKVNNLSAYLEDLKVLIAEKIIYNKTLRGEVIVQKPFAIITYQTQKMTEPKSFKIYPLFNPTMDRGDGKKGVRQQINRYYLDGGENYFYVMQESVLKKMFWKYDAFFSKGLNSDS